MLVLKRHGGIFFEDIAEPGLKLTLNQRLPDRGLFAENRIGVFMNIRRT